MPSFRVLIVVIMPLTVVTISLTRFKASRTLARTLTVLSRTAGMAPNANLTVPSMLGMLTAAVVVVVVAAATAAASRWTDF